MPLLMVVVSPASALVPVVSAASLGFLALLGAIGARAGGANVLRATARVTFWGALAMALTAGIGKAFRHSCVKIGAAQTSAPGTKRTFALVAIKAKGQSVAVPVSFDQRRLAFGRPGAQRRTASFPGPTQLPLRMSKPQLRAHSGDQLSAHPPDDALADQ